MFCFLTIPIAALILIASSTANCQTVAATASAAQAAKVLAAPQASDTGEKTFEGLVTYYGAQFNGRKTANGERFDIHALTMAHKTLPFGTRVKVTNLSNKRSVIVRVNDRGPMTPDRIGDLTTAAARKIGMLRAGVVPAKLEVLGTAETRKSVAQKG